MTAPGGETIDVVDIARSLRRRWYVIAAGMLAGLLLAVVVILLAPRTFTATATAVVRPQADAGASLLSRAAGDLAGLGAVGSAMGAGAGLETEIQILQSASVLGAVIDTLSLQAVPRSPAGLPSRAFVSAARLPGLFKPYRIDAERTPAGSYRVRGDKLDVTVAARGIVATPVGPVTLAEAPPPRFSLLLLDREDALKRVGKSFDVRKAGGDVLKVAYAAHDSLTAAMVPNVALAEYLRRKKTSDRGVNAHRAEFLTTQIDSISVQLAERENALRHFQERSGLVDAEVVGKLELEQLASLRKDLGAVEVEAVALDRLLSQIAAGTMSARQLVSFPTFLKSPAINSLLQQLSTLETERTRLLDRRTEKDPEVVALTRSIADVEGQLVPLARSYRTSLQQQHGEISAQLASMSANLQAFPGAAEEGARLLRDVKRLGATQTALQTQLVQAQLSTVGEGGDVRALDVATVPRTPSFPQPLLMAGVGAGAGLVLGILIALIGGSRSKYFEDPYAIERSLGVPAIRFDPNTPLLMSGRTTARTVLLIPLEPGVSTEGVAGRLEETALARGERSTILDLTRPSAPAPAGVSLGGVISDLERDHGLVIIRLPHLAAEATAAVLSESRPVLLVAPSRRVNRRELVTALETLRRLDVPCAGVVLSQVVPGHAVVG